MGLTQPHVTLVFNIILTLTKLWPASLVHHWPLSYMSVCVVWLTCHRLYKEVWQYKQHQPVLLFCIYFVGLCNYTHCAITICIVIPVNNCVLNKTKSLQLLIFLYISSLLPAGSAANSVDHTCCNMPLVQQQESAPIAHHFTSISTSVAASCNWSL